MQTVKVRLDGPGGLAMPEKILKTVYASGMDFEPDERRLRIAPDGTVELQVSQTPYMIHAKIQVPLYGQLWVMADGRGEGYTGDFVDFVSEAVRTYIAWARRFSNREREDLPRDEPLLAALLRALGYRNGFTRFTAPDGYHRRACLAAQVGRCLQLQYGL